MLMHRSLLQAKIISRILFHQQNQARLEYSLEKSFHYRVPQKFIVVYCFELNPLMFIFQHHFN